MKTYLVTGGAGFIGANFVLAVRERKGARVLNLDKLTYAGNLENLASLARDEDHVFVHGDIGDRTLTASIFREHRPTTVINFAAESHVDRSIHGPAQFIETNILGTFNLLETVREYWRELSAAGQEQFRFLHVSTDEVYGSLKPEDPAFTEETAYAPNSPYAASKAASDHLVHAYHHTYGLPTLITNCSNNYGPYQFPEKLIPLMICSALDGKPLPVYGDGLQVRDWLFVGDHCNAILAVLARGVPGETYNIGGRAETTNLALVTKICAIVDDLAPTSRFRPHQRLITHVEDRPGHDRRYAIDHTKITRALGWKPTVDLDGGMRETVRWYLENQSWVNNVRSGEYRTWMDMNYGSRATLG
jgi:dTDP-glucose 4,6-dehydratase